MALKALRELGLTEYETAAYLALVQGGQMAASDVSQKSQVPYSRIYDVLGRLEEKGFIQIQRGRPTMYVAKAPVEVVKLVRLSWEERMERSSRIVVEELQVVEEIGGPVGLRDGGDRDACAVARAFKGPPVSIEDRAPGIRGGTG
ncbi:MAG: TrmB family transcriptional regulator, partial [Candidatus Thorarchaeota archaeon]